MKTTLIIFCLFISTSIFCQQTKVVYEGTISEAQFPGGEYKLVDYIKRGIKHRFKKFEGQVYLTVEISSSGAVKKVKVESENKKLDAEIEKLLMKNEISWIPEKIDGENSDGIMFQSFYFSRAYD